MKLSTARTFVHDIHAAKLIPRPLACRDAECADSSDDVRRLLNLRFLMDRLLHGLVACVAAASTASAGAQSVGENRFACCNLRHEKSWMSDRPILARPFVPVGTRVKIVDFGRNRVHVEIEGKRFTAGIEHGDFGGTRETFANTLFVSHDPLVRLATFEPAVQSAIRAGRIRLGMTREQVVMALGHPRFEFARWTYLATEDGGFELDWDAEGRLSVIHAPSRVRALVVAS